MNIKLFSRYITAIFLMIVPRAHSIPNLNLGFTNILDGGPIRPAPGWYFQGYTQYYHTNKFVDGQGNNLGCIPSPTFNLAAAVFQIIYQSNYKPLFEGNLGFSAFIPFALYSKIECNTLDLRTSGPGAGDLTLGVYLQWDPIKHHGREIFIHRIEMDFYFPTGKNQEPCKSINIGNGVYVFEPYWAATLYIKKEIALSWRAHYTWSTRNKNTGIKNGDIFHINTDFTFEPHPKLWIGICSYYLQQLQNNTLCCKQVQIPDSKSRIFGLGPGFLYFLPKDFQVFGYLYFESLARNFTQGTSFIARLVKYF